MKYRIITLLVLAIVLVICFVLYTNNTGSSQPTTQPDGISIPN